MVHCWAGWGEMSHLQPVEEALNLIILRVLLTELSDLLRCVCRNVHELEGAALRHACVSDP